MTSEQVKPGPGWTCAGPCVYDHTSGTRIHTYGLVRVNGEIIDGGQYPELNELNRYIRANGGNRKRGVMAWGLSK